MQKSTLSLTFALLLSLFLFTACANSTSGPLTPADFNLYLNGKIAVQIDEVGMFKTYGLDEPYATRRGITIGSSLNDIAQAYGVVDVLVLDDELSSDEATEIHNATIGYSLRQYLAEYPATQRGSICYRISYINGTWTDSRENSNTTPYDRDIPKYYLYIGFFDGYVIDLTVYTGEALSENVNSILANEREK